MKAKLFILDDDIEFCAEAEELLRETGYTVESANTLAEAYGSWHVFEPEIALLDLRLPDGDGIELLAEIKRHAPETLVVMLSGTAMIADAVAAMKQGAEDFLAKPVDPDHLILLLEKLLEKRQLRNTARVLELEIAQKRKMIVGASKAMESILDTCERAARSGSTILINGETGTGKHLIAHFIHQHSNRKEFPFVYVNCATLSETLLESDLFGHEKGAFTGAVKQKPGRVEMAAGGTLFLDEIGEIPLNLQAKLLHFIEYGEFQRVGGTSTRSADTRIICATNRNLPEAVTAGNFREDLYYRINVIQVHIPPLRERREDIPPLLDFFIEKYRLDLSRDPLQLSAATRRKLIHHSWRGNIRELENSVERAVVLSIGNMLGDSDFPFLERPLAAPGNDIYRPRPLQDALNDYKREYIECILKETDGNQTEAAKILEIQRSYLNQLIKKLAIK